MKKNLYETRVLTATIEKEITGSARVIPFISSKEKTRTTDIRVFVRCKTLRFKESAERDGRNGRRGSVTPNCINSYVTCLPRSIYMN